MIITEKLLEEQMKFLVDTFEVIIRVVEEHRTAMKGKDGRNNRSKIQLQMELLNYLENI